MPTSFSVLVLFCFGFCLFFLLILFCLCVRFFILVVFVLCCAIYDNIMIIMNGLGETAIKSEVSYNRYIFYLAFLSLDRYHEYALQNFIYMLNQYFINAGKVLLCWCLFDCSWDIIWWTMITCPSVTMIACPHVTAD